MIEWKWRSNVGVELPSGSGLEWPLTTSAVSAVSHLTVAAPNASSPGRIAPSFGASAYTASTCTASWNGSTRSKSNSCAQCAVRSGSSGSNSPPTGQEASWVTAPDGGAEEHRWKTSARTPPPLQSTWRTDGFQGWGATSRPVWLPQVPVPTGLWITWSSTQVSAWGARWFLWDWVRKWWGTTSMIIFIYFQNYRVNLERSHSSVSSSSSRISKTLVSPASSTRASLVPAYITWSSGLQSLGVLKMKHIG